jgi:hypothetical protein
MAARLQYGAATFTNRLVDTSRIRQPIFTATVPRRSAMRRLCALARCSELAGSQPPNSTCHWINNGGNATLPQPPEVYRYYEPEGRLVEVRESKETD